jgi:hypothetical protein
VVEDLGLAQAVGQGEGGVGRPLVVGQVIGLEERQVHPAIARPGLEAQRFQCQPEDAPHPLGAEPRLRPVVAVGHHVSEVIEGEGGRSPAPLLALAGLMAIGGEPIGAEAEERPEATLGGIEPRQPVLGERRGKELPGEVLGVGIVQAPAPAQHVEYRRAIGAHQQVGGIAATVGIGGAEGLEDREPRVREACRDRWLALGVKGDHRKVPAADRHGGTPACRSGRHRRHLGLAPLAALVQLQRTSPPPRPR